MASRSLGELLLRPSPWTRTLLSPSAHTPALARPRPRTRPSWHPTPPSHRRISATPSAPAQPQRKEDDSDSDYEPAAYHAQEPQPGQPPRRDAAAEASPFSAQQPSKPAAFPPMFAPPTDRARLDRLLPFAPRAQTSSSDEMGAALFGAEWAKSGSLRPPRLQFDDMALPDSIANPSLANKPTEAQNLAKQQEDVFANYPRLNPTYGRTIELDVARGRDLVRGVGMLASLVARNKIKNDQIRQRFHERGGLKRKRLASERWRARFKIGFTDVTRRVSELTRKGW